MPELNICGPAYRHAALKVNNQRCVNLFTMTAGPDGRGKTPLLPTAGLELLIDLGDDYPIRSLYTAGGFVYAVGANTVFKLTVDNNAETATSATIGTLSSSEGPVSVASNPTQIIWTDETEGRLYTPGIPAFAAISDADFIDTSGQVVFIDSYFITNELDSGRIHFSSQNDGTGWDASEVATAESNTDDIVGLGVAKGELWVFGKESTEIWYNAANASGAPFSPRAGLEMRVGCGAKQSIVLMNDTLIWLDNRGFIVQSSVSSFIRNTNSGYDIVPITDEAITTEILGYSRRDDAIGMSYNYRGHLMYQITFPTAQKTWVYDSMTKSWHERSYYNSETEEQEYHLGQFYAQFEQLHLMAGIRDGKIYLVKPTYYDDNGVAIRRIRTTAPQYDKDGFRSASVDMLEVGIDIGDSTVSDPRIGLRYSHDGGRTWSDQMDRSMGAVGEYDKRVTWNRLGSGREWVFEFTIVEPMPFTIIDAAVNVSALEN